MPAGAGWLNDKLLARISAMPLNRFKRFTTAGVKAAQMYKVKKPKWGKAMSEATEKYARIRESGKRTKREHENWPKGVPGSRDPSKNAALGTGASGKQEGVEQERPVPLPAISYCAIL